MDAQMTNNEVRTVKTPSEELALFFSDAHELIRQCEQQLRHSPSNFRRVERKLCQAFRKGSGNIAAALLVASSKDSATSDKVEDIQQSSAHPLRKPVLQTLVIRLLSGLLLQVTILYCAPKGKSSDATEVRTGLYPELAAYGFAKKSSAAFEEEVTRKAALCPSFELATQELERDGVDINVKEVRRVATQCGTSLLALRRVMVQSFLSGTLKSGNELAGEHVVVSTDGGRMKHRKNKAQNRSGKHPKYHTEWREPKLIIIYIVDANGKKKKKSRFWLDGTFLGPDNLAEMLAAWLFRLGITRAASVTFIADGAPWIWDRFDWVVEQLKLPKEKVEYVLDFYHAAHHIGLALAEIDLPEDERRRLYQELRSELRQSRWQSVVGRLEALGGSLLSAEDSIFCRELRFLRKHGESGHLNYVKYTRRGLPKGSGAMESAVRRVINLRLKGNGMFWTPENAESMLQVRCQLLSSEWDVRMEELYQHRLRTRRSEWQWQATDRSRKTRNETKTEENGYRNAEKQRKTQIKNRE